MFCYNGFGFSRQVNFWKFSMWFYQRVFQLFCFISPWRRTWFFLWINVDVLLHQRMFCVKWVIFATRNCKCKKLQNRWALTSGELKQMHQRAISILKYRRGRFILDAKAMRRPGIETGSQEWEPCMIPLHQRREFLHHDTIFGSVISIQLRSALFRTVVLSQLYTTEIRAITPSQFYTPQIRTITMLYNSIFFTTSNNTN